MNTRLLLKLIVVLAVLLFMVMMGLSNNNSISFKLFGKKIVSDTPSAIVYFIFYGAGIFSGALLAVGWRSGK